MKKVFQNVQNADMYHRLKHYLERVHLSVLDVVPGIMKAPSRIWHRMWIILWIGYREHLSSVATKKVQEREKTQYEMRWMYDPTQKLYIAKYVKVEKCEKMEELNEKEKILHELNSLFWEVWGFVAKRTGDHLNKVCELNNIQSRNSTINVKDMLSKEDARYIECLEIQDAVREIFKKKEKEIQEG